MELGHIPGSEKSYTSQSHGNDTEIGRKQFPEKTFTGQTGYSSSQGRRKNVEGRR
jgi:hypothetical protein